MWRAVMRIALVKPEKARQVEEMMLQMAKRGQIGDRVRAPSLS
jgi:DNA-binding TFAR19-related protein (PDSD5 family)